MHAREPSPCTSSSAQRKKSGAMIMMKMMTLGRRLVRASQPSASAPRPPRPRSERGHRRYNALICCGSRPPARRGDGDGSSRGDASVARWLEKASSSSGVRKSRSGEDPLLGRELHVHGVGIVDGRDEFAWTAMWRLRDAAFEERIVSRGEGAFGSASVVGFEGGFEGALWLFEDGSTTTLDEGNPLHDELLLVSCLQSGQIAEKSHPVLRLERISESPHSLNFDAHVVDSSSGIFMRVALATHDEDNDGGPLALAMTITPMQVGDGAATFHWSRRRITFTVRDGMLLCHRISIFDTDGVLQSVFTAARHEIQQTGAPVDTGTCVHTTLPIPRAKFGVDSVVSARAALYERPEDNLVPETSEFFAWSAEEHGSDGAVLSPDGKIYIDVRFAPRRGDACGENVEPGAFLMDTGATCSLLDERLLRDDDQLLRFTQISEDEIELSGWGSAGAVSTAWRSESDAILCGMRVAQQRFVSFAFEGLGMRSGVGRPEVVGIVGNDMLSRAVVAVTCDESRRHTVVRFLDPVSFPTSGCSYRDRIRWGSFEMIHGIPHVLCRCRKVRTKPKGFASTNSPASVDDLFMTLGVDTGFNNREIRSSVSVAITDDDQAQKLLSAFASRADASRGTISVGGLLHQRRRESVSDAYVHAGDLSGFELVLRTDSDDEAVSFGDVHLFVSSSLMQKEGDHFRRSKYDREGESRAGMCGSSGMISSTIFFNRTVILDFSKQRIGFI